MKIILTGSKGTVAYLGGNISKASPSSRFAVLSNAIQGKRCGFARLPISCANTNHAPLGYEGANTSDEILDFLYSVAGAR